MSASEFYNQVNNDYLHWSKNLNIHFGYFKWPYLSQLFSNEKMLAEMNRQVLAKLGVGSHENATLLDVGCGIGSASIQMSETLQGSFFYGVNISERQIGYGEKMIQQQNLQNRIKLLLADFTKVPLDDAFFDAAFAIESACYGKGKEKKGFIDEMSRLIKSGGRLVVADGFKKQAESWPSWLERVHRQNLDYWAIEEMANIELFIQKMEESGFVEIEAEEISWNIAPSAAYLPFVAMKLFLKRLFSKNRLSAHQKNYLKAIWLTLFLGLFRQHFGYYLISAKRR